MRSLSSPHRAFTYLSSSRHFASKSSRTTTKKQATSCTINAASTSTKVSDGSALKEALNSIPSRVLHQLLRSNRIKISSGIHHFSDSEGYSPSFIPPKKLLCSKLYRLTSRLHSSSSPDTNASRLEAVNFSKCSGHLLRELCLKMREFNSYFNAHHVDIDRNHPFYLTLHRLWSEMDRVNDALYEMQCSSSNPPLEPDPTSTSLHSLHGFKRDLLYELLPSMSSGDKSEGDHLDADSVMLSLCESFIKFTNFPRCTVLDHLWYISNLCHFRDVLDSFLLHHHTQSVHRVHPSRTTKYSDDHYDDDDDEYDDDDDHEDGEEEEEQRGPPLNYRDDDESDHFTNNRRSNISRRRLRASTSTSSKPPLDEEEQKAFYMKRLRQIYEMDLGQFGIFGVDQHLKAQLRRTLLSRGLHPLLINSKNAKSQSVSSSDIDGDSESDPKSESNSNSKSVALSMCHHKGILLHGPPGTGKTMLAKAVQHLLLVSDGAVSVVSGPEMEDIYIGQTERNIRNLFEGAKADWREWGALSPLHLVIFDEMDSIAKKRDSSSYSKVYDRSVQQLLSCLDGAAAMDNVVVIGTTNRYQDIDPALLRPGRFGVHILMPLPDDEQRRELLTKSSQNWTAMDTEQVTMEWLVSLTDGLSQSDIAALLSQSKMNAVERIIEEWFVENDKKRMDGEEGMESMDNHVDNGLYERISNDFKVTATDIMCALDEIRINQVHRERNNRHHGADYAFDFSF